MRSTLSGILILLALASGCSQYRRVASVNFVEMGPELILQQASDRAGEVVSLLTTGTVQIQSARGAYTARVMIIYARPDSIRIDVSVPLGGVVARAVVVGDDIQIYLPADKVVIEGDLSADQYFDFLGIPLERALLTELVIGPALTWNWVDLAARIDQFDVGPDQVTYGLGQAGGRRFILSLNPEMDYWKSVRVDSGGRILLETFFYGYRRFAGARLPQKVVLGYPAERFRLDFEVVNRRSEPDHSPADFTLRLPMDVMRLPLYTIIPPLPGP